MASDPSVPPFPGRRVRACISREASSAAAFSSDCEPRTNLPARAEFPAAIISFIFAVSDGTLSLGGSKAGLKIIRHFPGPSVIKGGGDQGRAGAFAEQRRERRSRGQPPEERRPKAMVARVLVAQNPDHPAAAEEPDCLLEAFAPVEELDPKAGPLLPNEPIEVAVAQFLINGAQPRVGKSSAARFGQTTPSCRGD